MGEASILDRKHTALLLQGRITEPVERIKQDFASFEGRRGRESRVFIDQQEIHGMSDWRQRILQGLRESRLLLACLSPAYLQSEYCEWEFVEYPKSAYPPGSSDHWIC